jgi:hypothetical protein
MSDTVITGLRVAPATGARVPTTWRAYCVTPGGFLLNDADNTSIAESSPYDQSVGAYKIGNLTSDGSGYVAADFTLPSTVDSLDKPDTAKWGIYVHDANGRVMYPVAGLASFSLSTDSPQTVEDIVTFNLGTLPAAADRDVHVTGDLEVDGNVSADSFTGSAAGLHDFPGGAALVNNAIVAPGSAGINADSDGNGVGEAYLAINSITKFRAKQDGLANESLVPLILPGYPTGSLPSPAPARSVAFDTTRDIAVRGDGTNWRALFNQWTISVKDDPYNAKGDVVDVQTGGVNVGTPNTITGATGLTTDNIGNIFVLQGAGVAGAPLQGTITAILSSTSFTSSVAASTTVSNQDLYWGTDDSAAFTAAIAALPDGGELIVPPGQYIANFTINKKIHLRGVGTWRPYDFIVTSPPSLWDKIDGLVIRSGNSASDVVSIVDVQGPAISDIAFDAANLSPYAVTIDRVQKGHFDHIAGLRGLTAGMRIGTSSNDGTNFGSVWNHFSDLMLTGNSGLQITKWGTGVAGAFYQRFYGLTIEYWGQGATDNGFRLMNGDQNVAHDSYIVDHVNGSPKPAVYIDTWVDKYSPYDNIFHNLEPGSGGLTVAENNPFAGAVYEYQQGNGAPDPVIPSTSRMLVVRRGGAVAGNPNEGETHYAVNDSFNVFSGYGTGTPRWTAYGIGRTSREAFMGFVEDSGRFLSDDEVADLVFVNTDETKAIRFGFKDVTNASTLTLKHLRVLINGIPSYANNAAAVSAGEAVGTLYRNGDVLQIVH